MKKVLYLISLLALIVTPNIASAHLHGAILPGLAYNIGTRVEVTKDGGANWYSYDSSDASSLGTGYTLPISPGDNITMRIKVWNDGNFLAFSTQATGETTGFEYLTGLSGSFDNPDEDGNSVNLEIGSDIKSFSIIGLNDSQSATSGYDSATINATVRSDAPAGAVIMLNYTINSATDVPPGGPMSNSQTSSRSLFDKFFEWFTPVAYADDDSTATSGLRMEVSTLAAAVPAASTVTELPKTGQDVGISVATALLLLSLYFVGRKIILKNN